MSLRLALTALLVCALALGGLSCQPPTPAEEKGKLRVGIVFDIGGKDDRSFNAAAWEGVRRAAKDFPIVLRDVEPGNPTSIEPAIRAFAERGYDLIIAIGFAQAPILEVVAKDYPNINFAIVDGASQLPNVASLVFKEHEGSYLVGMIAARTSKTGVLGFVGGMDIPLIHRFKEGYEQGAKAVNPDAQVIANYVGVTDSAWNNPGKGKELALAQLGKGVDVIFTAAGNSGLGAFDAVEQQGKGPDGRAKAFVIGVDSNQNGVKPGFVLTSMVKRVDNAVYHTVQDVVERRFKTGFHVFGLDKDGVGYSLDQFNRDLIPRPVLDEAEAARAKIIECDKRKAEAGAGAANVRCEIEVVDAMAPKKT
ncbi:MAG TPA: BMP family ABC transporter substrate-binding protein [Pyrinomonadaceae bacterium]|nr:BMP family ABC transporter substrate-binding protein [Pyrinomonadaceae bacterium]